MSDPPPYSPATHAAADPDRPAVIMGGSGDVITYGELDERSNRFARLLRERGLGHGDHIAIFMENHLRYFEVAWAAQRSGLFYTPINSFLTAEEVGYILDDCDARVLATTAAKRQVTAAALAHAPRVQATMVIDGDAGGFDGFESYEEAVAGQSSEPLDDEREGSDMFYSSGTTGQPKGVQRLLPLTPFGTEAGSILQLFAGLLGFEPDMTYLTPAPLYHSAPLISAMAAHRLGATAVAAERFDPAATLGIIERYRVTHAQFVPTMFVRMLKLPEEERLRFDTSTLRVAIHAAAPCPVPVKERMIEWWGPVLREYYAGTEGVGFCFIDSEDWLNHKGSVGRSMMGPVHVLDDEGRELGAGEVGELWFEGGPDFAYHKDADKTRAAKNERGWATLRDMGYIDDDGFVYLTDRSTFMIVSGGVNIYPQEIENLLVVHPKVADAAVFGVPNEEFGEEVKAVVQPLDGIDAGPDLAAELVAHCREHLAGYKVPRSVDFEAELPRLPTGKLYKRQLRDRYWGEGQSRILR